MDWVVGCDTPILAKSPVSLFLFLRFSSEKSRTFFWNLFKQVLNLISSVLYMVAGGATVEKNLFWNIVCIVVGQCVHRGF
jgi:hypothetical protein